jgi:hypothetical protein
VAPRLAGGCACGAITFECDVEPIIMLNCHCRNCQRASGSAFAPVVFVPKTGIGLLGKPRYYGRVGDAGKSVERGFCPSCGSQVTMKMERFPDALGLQAGCLDDPSMYKPSMDIFIAVQRRGITWIPMCRNMSNGHRCETSLAGHRVGLGPMPGRAPAPLAFLAASSSAAERTIRGMPELQSRRS